MSEIVGAVALSHSPFWDSRVPIEAAERNGFLAGVRAAQSAVAALAPTCLVVIGPDHFRNLWYDLMPPFTIGADRATSFGDWTTPPGPLPAHGPLARALHRHLAGGGFDPALSLHLGVDHGIVQPYFALAPSTDVALVPVVVSCAGPAMPSPARCRAFGAALGAALRSVGDQRVVVVGSGGLSHWLPSSDPDDPAVEEAWRSFLVDGRPDTRRVAAEREAQIRAVADTLDGRVAPVWDRAVLDLVAGGDLAPCDDWDAAGIEAAAGNGGQEVRTWIVAAAAWGGPLRTLGYEAMPRWLTGMGVAGAFG